MHRKAPPVPRIRPLMYPVKGRTESPVVMRFLNQKLGKRVSRRLDLLKWQLAGRKRGDVSTTPDLRIPKKGASREGKPLRTEK